MPSGKLFGYIDTLLIIISDEVHLDQSYLNACCGKQDTFANKLCLFEARKTMYNLYVEQLWIYSDGQECTCITSADFPMNFRQGIIVVTPKEKQN